ncbi:MAG: response regulator transcription factor [Alphaproteobacteria bacterium]|jgi:DNA-binding NarL/FixJ family response regulator
MAGSASVPQRQIPIVDDHPLAQRGLAALINSEPALVVCVQAASRREAIDAIAAAQTDLVIVDLSLTDDDGLDLVREVRTGLTGLPVLTIHETPLHRRCVFTPSAGGYATKREMTDALLRAIRRVLRASAS